MNDQIKLLNTKRGQIKAKVTRFKTYLEQISINKDTSQLKFRLSNFQNYLSEFELIQGELESLEEADPNHEIERESFENTYFELLAKAETLVPLQVATAVAERESGSLSLSSTHPQVKLPTIKLPTFNGKYEEWTSFSELFQSLIDENESISNVQKFHYLKTSLQGQASSVIESLELTSANYKTAWDLLKTRFENKRIVITSHIAALHQIEKIEKESAQALRNLLDNTNKNLRALQSLGEPVDKWDSLLIYTITKKLDAVTFRSWENHIASTNIPTFSEFTDFLELRCNTLESIESNKVSKKEHTAASTKPHIFRRPSTTSLVANTTSIVVVYGGGRVCP